LGQVLVFAAVGMVLFLAVAGLVIDLGLLWTTRRHTNRVRVRRDVLEENFLRDSKKKCSAKTL
jgi:Putative Flp pilus-assembly TadE/G-like